MGNLLFNALKHKITIKMVF